MDSCTAELPNSRCDAGVRSPLCGALCGLSFDYTTSTVTLPPGQDTRGISIPDRIKETACYTNALEPIFKKNHKEFNATGLYKVLPNQYFGDRHGLFRMFPGRHFDKCGEYDPRSRPWYLSGSSQPKSVIIIMDLSGSMTNKIDMVRDATKHLISTSRLRIRLRSLPLPLTASPPSILALAASHMAPFRIAPTRRVSCPLRLGRPRGAQAGDTADGYRIVPAGRVWQEL